ncbi:MAG TPA: endolytic transglycosylase MltG [Bacillota bacterium]|nr:endolytic transglycosylase MltG [Bacillota bacterium]
MIRIKKKHRFILFILIVLLLIVLSGWVCFSIWMSKESGPSIPGSTETVLITIPQGMSTKSIGELLASGDIISDALVFRLKSRLEGYDGKFKAGEYSLSSGMTMDEIMDLLLEGHRNTQRFTIPEGYDLKRTADKLEEQGLIDREAFFKEIREGDFDYWFIDGLKEGSSRLEGFLYPDTYEIYINAGEHDIIDKMLSQFSKVFNEDRINRMNELGMNLNEIITLASIIEREAVISEDRPVIAGVFLKRLDMGMPLQSCATVQYILGEQKPVLSTADTKIQSPYNTYVNKGLPPTPICSPGIESIDAALWPETTDYLFFLAKGDGSHVFSVTYEEHIRNKAKYID